MKSRNIGTALSFSAAVFLLFACGTDSKVVFSPTAPVNQTAVPKPTPIPESPIVLANRALVAKFLTEVPPGARFDVAGLPADPHCGSRPFRFQVASESDGLHLWMDVFLLGNDGPKVREQHMQRLKACMPKIQAMWKRYDVNLDIHWKLGDRNHPYAHGEMRKLKSGKPGPIDACGRNIWLESDPEESCLALTREIGYWLGLGYEYEVPGMWRTQATVSSDRDPFSAMHDPYVGWSRMEFYPRHFQKLFDTAKAFRVGRKLHLIAKRDIRIEKNTSIEMRLNDTDVCQLNLKPGLNLRPGEVLELTLRAEAYFVMPVGQVLFHRMVGRERGELLNCRGARLVRPDSIQEIFKSDDFTLSFE